MQSWISLESLDIPFTSKPTFISLVWDLSECTATLTETKRVKYVNTISQTPTHLDHLPCRLRVPHQPQIDARSCPGHLSMKSQTLWNGARRSSATYLLQQTHSTPSNQFMTSLPSSMPVQVLELASPLVRAPQPNKDVTLPWVCHFFRSFVMWAVYCQY